MKRIREAPYKQIIDEEWKRCKPMAMHLKRKPDVYWMTSGELKGALGRAWRWRNRIGIRERYILLEDDYKEFRDTLRHELAHLADPSGGHGKNFLFFMERFGGSRYVSSSAANVVRKKRRK